MTSKSLHSAFGCESESSFITARPNDPEEDCRLVSNKKKASKRLESVRKRQREASHPSDVAVETETSLIFKKKTKTEGAAPSKRKSSHSTRKRSELKAGLKTSYERQASQVKKKRSGNETENTEATSVSSESVDKAGKVHQLTARSPGSKLSSQHDIILQPTRVVADFEAKYLQQDKLGKGGFGLVYAGVRKTDHFPVAIKHIPLADVENVPVVFHGRVYMTPLEVLLLCMMERNHMSGGQSAAVSLLDWYILDQEVLLVMERPVPSVDLLHYLQDNGPLKEDTAKNIMKQLVEAALYMHSARVFHRDLKSENILIQTASDELRVRLIDFGCGCIVEDAPCHSFCGTFAYAPPEFYFCEAYEAGPTTVWQLGALLYEMLGSFTRFSTIQFLQSEVEISNELSQNCQDFLWMCLDPNPWDRATLEDMQLHPWLKDAA